MGRLQFARAWILCGHGVAFASCLGLTALLIYFIREPYLGNNLTQVYPTIPSLYVPTVVVHVLGCVGHGLLFVVALVHTYQAIYRPRATTVQPNFRPRNGSTEPKWATARSVEEATAHGWWRRLTYGLARHKTALLALWGRHHAEITRLFILWEVAFQTFQANKISQLVPGKWINRFMAAIIVTNCWFSPVLHFFLGAHPKTFVRLARLLMDSCLDVVYSIGIPIAIFYPYYRDYEGGLTLFPALLYFTDTWYINAISELRQFFVTSYLDLLSRCTGVVALQYRLYTISKAISEAEREARVRASRRNLSVRTVHGKSRLSRVLDVVLIAWGATVLSLHTHAGVTSLLKHNAGCLLEMRPWGSPEYTCAVLEVSCSRSQAASDRNVVHDMIASVNPATVQILILSNCPDLYVPPAVQRLANLLTLKIYNSTVSEWGEDAALTSTHHPWLQSLYCARLDMRTIPLGLLAEDFPTTLWAVFFSVSNVVHFPDRLPWRGVTVLAIEGNSAFHTIPRSVLNLPRLTMVGLRHNAIEAIADDALAATSFLMLDVAANPLTQLPASIGNLDTLQIIDIRGTQIGTVPASWSQRQPLNRNRPPIPMDAGSSPLCDNRATWNATAVPWLTLLCAPIAGGLLPFAYPIDEEDTWRRANQ